MTSEAEARSLGCDRKTLSKHSMALSSCLYEASRMGLQAFCRHLIDLAQTKKTVRLLAAYLFERYDETPSKISVKDSTQQGTSSTQGRAQTQTAKVLQSEASVSFVIEEIHSKQRFMFSASLATHLMAMDHGSAECLKACLERNFQVPLLEDFAKPV